MDDPLFKPESIHPLSGVDPDLPMNDLEILGDITAKARIVALGEPTHGQKEINQLRDRITRYLVESDDRRCESSIGFGRNPLRARSHSSRTPLGENSATTG